MPDYTDPLAEALAAFHADDDATQSSDDPSTTLVIDLPTLAAAMSHWRYAYGITLYARGRSDESFGMMLSLSDAACREVLAQFEPVIGMLAEVLVHESSVELEDDERWRLIEEMTALPRVGLKADAQ